MLNHNNLGPISFIPVQKGSKMLRNQGLYFFFSYYNVAQKKKKIGTQLFFQQNGLMKIWRQTD